MTLILPEQDRASSILPDGRRKKVILSDVSGTFTKIKALLFPLLIAVYALLPFIKIKGNPAVFIDIEHRRFYLFGLVFNAQDTYLVFFILTGFVFGLFFLTALFGRVWCGFACPQYVFFEGVFRRIERLIEGPRSSQIQLNQAPWGVEKILKKTTKHIIYLFFAGLVAHIFLSYFLSMDHLLLFMQDSPFNHPTAFVWMLVVTGLLYVNFAWFREQLCLIVCPYGRLQSALIDNHSIIVGYDTLRGEPRGKKSDPARGDCINCKRCIDVCPTGIDIRAGLQLECLGCGNCIDACNDIMKKVDQKAGLIRLDSLNGLSKKKRHFLRPRIFLYTGLLLLGSIVFSIVLANRASFEANLLRLQGPPYVLQNSLIRNQYSIHLVNKSSQRATFTISPQPYSEVTYILPTSTVVLESLSDRQIPLFAEIPQSKFKGDFKIEVKTTNLQTTAYQVKVIPFLGPN